MTRRTLLGTNASAPGSRPRMASRTRPRTSRSWGVLQGIADQSKLTRKRLRLLRNIRIATRNDDAVPEDLKTQVDLSLWPAIEADQRVDALIADAAHPDVHGGRNAAVNERLDRLANVVLDARQRGPLPRPGTDD